MYYPKAGGDPIVGLTRLGDDRWKVSGPPVVKFTERSVSLAIALYHRILAERNPNGSWVDIPVSKADVHEIAP